MKLSDIHMRDPFVLVDSGVAYLYGTTDENVLEGKSSGFLMYKSTDLHHFEGPYQVFHANNHFWADMNFWAPEVYKEDGRYLMFATFKNEKTHRRSQILYADSPFGPFVPNSEPLTPKHMDSLDATYFVWKETKYTFFCHEWTQINVGSICAAKLNARFEITGKIVEVLKANEAEWTVSNDGKGSYVTDGPFLYNTGREVIMLWSSISKTGYTTGIAIHDGSKDLCEGWQILPAVLPVRDAGHAMLFEWNKQLYLTMHTPNFPFGCERPVFIPVYWNKSKLNFDCGSNL